jgi:DNA-binding NtrC family response regulator
MDLLLVEDKDSFRKLLEKALEGSAWTLTAVADPGAALRELETRPFRALVTDLRLPGMSGLDLIRQAKRRRPELRVLLMSAFGEPRDIVEAMKLGAEDFLPKPFDLDRFLAMLERLRGLAGAPPPSPSEPWIASSPAMQELDAALRRAAETRLPVLFRGAAGVGKARAARRLHLLRDPHAPFLVLDAEGLGEQGVPADTIRLLEGGSLLVKGIEGLSAIGAMALARSMESASGIGWMGAVAEGRDLPEPLRHRLDVLDLRVPALSERRADVVPLLRAFLEAGAMAAGRPRPWLERSAEKELLERDFPGNARQLEQLAARVLLLNDGPAVRSLPMDLGGAAPLLLPWPDEGPLEAMERTLLKAAEAHLLRRALEAHRGDLIRTAQSLGLSVRALGQRLKEHGIPLAD